MNKNNINECPFNKFKTAHELKIMISVGIDLAGLSKNPTGLASMNGNVKTEIVHNDNEIISFVKSHKPDIVIFDAPLSFPARGYFRSCEVELKNEGYEPLSPMFRGMRPLVERAIKLSIELRNHGFNVFETSSVIIRKILRVDDKFIRERYPYATKDEIDAILCALVGKLHLKRKTKSYGKENLLLPKI